MTEEATLVIYTHPDCEYSRMAKADLDREGIPYKEIDISKVRGAFLELERITGGERITPVMIEGERVTIGYGEGGLG